MRTIERTNQFKRDYKREEKRLGRKALASLLVPILTSLAMDEPMAQRHYDHALTGDWKDYRDCHIRPDTVLIYQKPTPTTLRLIRIGSHSNLGL